MAVRHKYKIGDKFRVTDNINRHSPGKTYTVKRVYEDASLYSGMDELTGSWVSPKYMVPVGTKRNVDCRDKLNAEKDKLEAALDLVSAKLAYLDDNKLDVFNEKEFKIYQALSILDSTSDKMVRVKQLAQLFKSCK